MYKVIEKDNVFYVEDKTLDTLDRVADNTNSISLTNSITNSITNCCNLKRVYCYKNLHKNLWSVKQSGKVISHVDSIIIKNVKFLVGKKGRERVIREKQKNVHAGVSGYVLTNTTIKLKKIYRVTYNPYKFKSFVRTDNEEPVYNCDFLIMEKNGVFVGKLLENCWKTVEKLLKK